MERAARKSCRTQLTKLLNNAKEKLSNADENVNELIVISDRIKRANESLELANKNVTVVILASEPTEEQLQEEFNRVLEYQDQIAEVLSWLQIRINEHARNSREEEEDHRSISGSTVSKQMSRDSNQRQGRANNSNVKLPKLELRKFRGELSDWTSFWEQFRTAVHENEFLDSVAKFNYLEQSLIGKAAATISGLTPSEKSYEYALELLQHEYGNKQRTIDNHVQKLLSITPVKSKIDAVGLRGLYNATSSITRNLTSLGVSPNEYGMMVKSVLLNAMPYGMKIDFNRQHPNDASNAVKIEDQIDVLLSYLKLEIESIEVAQTPSLSSNSAPVPCRERNKAVNHKSTDRERRRDFTAAGLLTTIDQCVFCKSSAHESENCKTTNDTLERKKEILKKSNRCLRCTKPGHISKYCRNKITCDACGYRHATAICDPSYKRVTTNANATAGLLTQDPNRQQVYLQTARAYIGSSEKPYTNAFIRAILDGGSQLSYVKQDLSRKLGLKIVGKCNLSVMAFGSERKTSPKMYNKVELRLSSQYDNEVTSITAIEVPEICFDSFQTPNVNHPLINGLNLADVSIGGAATTEGIALLVGADHYWNIVTGEFRRLTNDLTAINTKLGWTLQGPDVANQSTNANLAVIASTLHAQVFNELRDTDLKNFWELETIGISAKETKSAFTDEFIEKKIALNNDRFEVSLPWKNDCAVDNNRIGALSRMKSLTFKLSKNARLFEYDQAVRELVDSNVAEKVPSNCENEKMYYMPHRPVYREDKTTSKVRVVFDASSHAPGFPSLNELLHPGENLVQDLLKILLNFRVGNIAITADIEKAYLQIALHERDRDSHRFLWYESPLTDVNNLPPVREYRMARVKFGVTSSAFLLSATLKKLFKMHQINFPKTTDRLLNAFYVDDLVATVNSLEEATELYEESKYILKSAGMNLRKWRTNDREFQARINENETEIKEQSCPKVLGLYWDTFNDNLCLDLTSVISYIEKIQTFTKRNVLQAIGRIYDPLCILGPFTIKAKIILQRIWKLKIDWDAELPEDLRIEWGRWCCDVRDLCCYNIPRSVTSDVHQKLELHVFADASNLAYGAVAFVRQVSDNGVSVNFLIAKNRVAPIKDNDSGELTLPRLELTAALCASRLKDYIVKNVNLEFENVNLWSDSKIALYWIIGDASKWKSYVYNRVTEIQELTKDSIWRHCSGKVNPADLLTRGVRASELIASKCWLYGPELLTRADSDWLNENDFSESLYETAVCETGFIETELIESDSRESPNETVVCAIGSNEIKTCGLKPIFSFEEYERLEKFLRVTCYVKRVFRKDKSASKSLTTEELNDAENYWIKITQQQAFGRDIESLKKNGCVDKKSSIYKLTPFIDPNGILRIKSRLQESDLPYEAANPIIFPKKSPFVEKIIWQTHNRCFHGGINLTLSEIRKRYWIIRARQTIKSQIAKCVICKKLRGKPGQEVYAPLPKSRISKSCPFENTGVDFAGPLYVIENDQKRKTYLMLLTCAATRAVHLELVLDLTTESCVRGFRRFVARRGAPSTLYSDNARTFKRVSVELYRLYETLSTEEVADFCSNRRIKWNFIVERAAWWGGFWERLIKTVKDGLKFALGKAMVNVDELQTILTEIEATVNSRPLTYIDDDKDNLSVLSPSNFMLGNRNQCLLPAASSAANRETILAKWKERQRLLSKFWKKWLTEYLQQLRTAHVNAWLPPKISFSVGDIVLLHDQNAPRLTWRMVRITEVYPGRDGRVRACEVQLPNKTRLRRPVQLLYPLEIPIAAREGEENIRETIDEDVRDR